MKEVMYFAHSTSGPPSTWEPLADHLRAVGNRARGFAAAFAAAEWGELAGLWHDVGKYLPEFQRRLQGDPVRVDHAGPAAAAAMSWDSRGLPLALAIVGHHSGLPNYRAQVGTDLTPLVDRVEKQRPAWERIQRSIPAEFWPRELPALPTDFATVRADRQACLRALELWTRFLFSALVDADYLETERFYDPVRGGHRGGGDSLSVLRARLDAHLARFTADTPVNCARAEILSDCRRAARQPPGLFSLTVPTGGGKTLSGLAFALDHAIENNLRGVVVAIPYTSIIEQTAAIYRSILGDENVLEHHSNLDVQSRWEQDEELEGRRRLAAENWDAPVVVTTNVQLFESLLANQPSRCRKLHNLARSVFLLDEAQSLPIDMTMTIIDLLSELATRYSATIVLSTATQPALRERDQFAGLRNVREIITSPTSLADRLRRVQVNWPKSEPVPESYAQIAQEISDHPRVLAIVHRRRDARELASLIPRDGRFHLSALMCPAHRRVVLEEVRRRLAESGAEEGRPIRLIATQLVEAGVDIDFPVIYRALAGLDSIAQAAGRCDREGRATAFLGRPAGQVFVFRAPTNPPPGVLRQGLETTESMLLEFGDRLDIGDPRIFENYFRRLYAKHPLDRGLQNERAALNFATVADKSRLIEDDFMIPIVVPYRDSAERVARFRTDPTRGTQRALQPYLVQISPADLQCLESHGGVEPVAGENGVNVLTPACAHLYDTEFGLVVDQHSQSDPSAFVV
jgi:CRISPR-associated endonuclease/helicase Cas3